MITFTVLGTAAPKGSAKAFYRPGMKVPIVTHDSKRTKPWQESVVSAAADALAGTAPLAGPVMVRIVFFMPRPKSAAKRITRPATRPDVDKLLRCCLDGLTRAGAYGDDGQVVETHARKEFAGGRFDPLGDRGIPRAVITVEPADESGAVVETKDLFGSTGA